MTIQSVRLALYLGHGHPTPAPANITKAVQQVTVRQDDGGAQGFSLTLRAERDWAGRPDYALLHAAKLKPGSRLVIAMTLNATPSVLLDGVIDHIQLNPPQAGQAATITISGGDVSRLMDLVDVNMALPLPNITAVVTAILAKYIPLGITPAIIPTIKEFTRLPIERAFFQKGSDLHYLRKLAGENGYIFVIRPGPLPGLSLAYWGPLIKVGLPQKGLTVDMGHSTNIETINFEYDARKPRQVYGLVAQENTAVPVPVLSLTNIYPPPLASHSPFLYNQPYIKKERQTISKGGSVTEAYLQAQARVDESADSVVRVTGTLNALQYGAILRAPGIVGLCGAGQAHDGYYYVKSVTHTISQGRYQQQFVLGREGLGSIVNRINP
ncbi:MAG: hypothetical protein IPM39_19705 [Chloroflexi bacterium]|nr:hypothetical protein [Chloroflexota bacterium]